MSRQPQLPNQPRPPTLQHAGIIHPYASTFVWRINNFRALHASLRVGDKVCSPLFGVTGRLWRLELYPRGADIRHAEYATVILRNLGARDVWAICSIAIVNNRRMESVCVTMNARLYTRTFNDEVLWDRGDFVTQEILMNPINGLIVDDTVTMNCTITEIS